MKIQDYIKQINELAVSTSNKVEGYFRIGKFLLPIEDKVIDTIGKEMPSGYKGTDLKAARQFFKKFRNNIDYLDLIYQISWSHIKEQLIKDKLETEERFYYLQKTISENWTLKELKNSIEEDVYERFLSVLEKNDYKFTIEKLTIKNYKALKNIEIIKPSRFLVFAGANATGKSSIFEALEFLMHSAMTTGNFVFGIFGGKDEVLNYDIQQEGTQDKEMVIRLELSFTDESTNQIETSCFGFTYNHNSGKILRETTGSKELDEHIVNSFSRIFINNVKRAENKFKLPNKLWLDASNLNKILKNILNDDKKRKEINEWLELFIPEFEKIEVEKDLEGQEKLLVYETSYKNRAFSGKLISEGTMNILALIASIYQFDAPQFLSIEEPETGLNPAALKTLIPFFEEMTRKKKHHIWITTHSLSVVAELKNENQLAIVNKKEGKTNVNLCKEGDFEDMKPEEAWMKNMLKGGGLPW
jgi:predicted ATPase